MGLEASSRKVRGFSRRFQARRYGEYGCRMEERKNTDVGFQLEDDKYGEHEVDKQSLR